MNAKVSINNEQAYYFVPVNMPGDQDYHKQAGWWAIHIQELINFHKFELAQRYLTIAKERGCLDTINQAAIKHNELCMKYRHLTDNLRSPTKSGEYRIITSANDVVREEPHEKREPYYNHG